MGRVHDTRRQIRGERQKEREREERRWGGCMIQEDKSEEKDRKRERERGRREDGEGACYKKKDQRRNTSGQ